MAKTVVLPRPKPEWQAVWLECAVCGHRLDDWQPVNVPVATWVGHVRTYLCPDCGKGGKSVLLRSTPLDDEADPDENEDEDRVVVPAIRSRGD